MTTNYQRYSKAHYEERRALWFAENGPCVECGSWERLEVDHIDPEQKVSSGFWLWAEERREVELSKCRPLCYLCHQKRSVVQRREAAIKAGRVARHGTYSCYVSQKCRCEVCRAANTEYGRQFRQKRGVRARSEERPHGTCARYAKGCRCDDCRAAHAAYQRDYRARDQVPVDA